MANAQLYQNDLSNRFPTYTFNTTVNQSLTTFEALDGPTVVATATKLDLGDAVFNVRQQLVGGLETLPWVTTTQRDALSVLTGTPIFNPETSAVEAFDNSEWTTEAIAELKLNEGDGPTSQRLTFSDVKINPWQTNERSTAGVLTADEANEQITIDSVLNTSVGDLYEIEGSLAIDIPNRAFIVLELVHDDDSTINIIQGIPLVGVGGNNGPQSVSLVGSFVVTNATNQSFYINGKVLGGSKTVNYYSGNLILRRV